MMVPNYDSITYADLEPLDALIHKLENVFTETSIVAHSHDNRPYVLTNIIGDIKSARTNLKFWFIEGKNEG